MVAPMRRQTVLRCFEWVSICAFLFLMDLHTSNYTPGLNVASLELDMICDGISDDLTTIRSNGEYSNSNGCVLHNSNSWGLEEDWKTTFSCYPNSFVPREVTRSHRHAARARRAARPDVSLISHKTLLPNYSRINWIRVSTEWVLVLVCLMCVRLCVCLRCSRTTEQQTNHNVRSVTDRMRQANSIRCQDRFCNLHSKLHYIYIRVREVSAEQLTCASILYLAFMSS